ncbi:hypothetical protein GCM10007301_42160 [Azorhizobium oxalatiphilum]|uniref:Uncharacterized protein n=1 Tax=Azorhizobium oxalatiphilum TaxID=980631 RepID=A0A917FHT4_9HYPH|nr:hypothetical protein GCM10007301_42160 [Azorhizobium oxalatiphilum]
MAGAEEAGQLAEEAALCASAPPDHSTPQAARARPATLLRAHAADTGRATAGVRASECADAPGSGRAIKDLHYWDEAGYHPEIGLGVHRMKRRARGTAFK